MADIDIAQTAADTFGINKFNVGLSGIGNILAVIFIAVLLIAGVVTLIILWVNSKKYKHRIPLYRLIGNIPTKVAVYRAKDVPFGRAGDKLWFVKGKGLKKWIVPGTLQSGKNEYLHFEREDGEWINFVLDNLDTVMKTAGARYVTADMRMQRLATDKLLEQRLQKKNFWDQWGTVIMSVVFFLIIAIALVVFFYQYGKIVDKFASVIERLDTILLREQKQDSQNSLIPALLPIVIFRRLLWHHR